MKTAMKAGEKERLSVIRMLLAALQIREIETREDLSDADVLQIIEKQIKQRMDSAKQFADAGRDDRAAQETAEGESHDSPDRRPVSFDLFSGHDGDFGEMFHELAKGSTLFTLGRKILPHDYVSKITL